VSGLSAALGLALQSEPQHDPADALNFAPPESSCQIVYRFDFLTAIGSIQLLRLDRQLSGKYPATVPATILTLR